MKQKLLFFAIFFFCFTSLFSSVEKDSLSGKNPMFISLKGMGGSSLKTNDYLKSTDKTLFRSYSLRYGISPKNNSWANNAFRCPYAGIGFMCINTEDDSFGVPLSLYLFQGSRVAPLTSWISLFYECQLGYSFNWGHYDRVRQPDNICIGSSENVHVGLELYLKFYLSKYYDINIGGGFCHFSNGANMMPNKGMNVASLFCEVSYKFNETQTIPDTIKFLPQKEGNFEHQIMATISSRQKYFSVVGTGLSTQFVNHRFRVYGLSYSFMKIQNYKFRWGPSVEMLYDESSESYATRDLNPIDGKWYDTVHHGSPKDRFSLGFSLKGEIKMPYCSYFANFGYDVIHNNSYDTRLYQILGVKADFRDNVFGVFGIRATRFSKAQFFCWSLGYKFVK